MRETASEKLKKLRKEINDIMDRGIEQFLAPYADTETSLYLYIQGYTPDYNDGEACEHRSYAYDKYEIIEEEILDYNEDFFGNIDEKKLEESSDWPESEEFRDAVEGVQEALEYKYGTDYQVLITLKDGVVAYVRDHYDCGY